LKFDYEKQISGGFRTGSSKLFPSKVTIFQSRIIIASSERIFL